MVANSAKRLCWEGGEGAFELLDDVDDREIDATDEDVWWLYEGAGEDVPNNLLVEENNREGRRRLLEN